ncbi:FAD-dependent oxidoreductase [Arcticibacterium luteifluviistationis]|uniref:Pyridine nucleotide-disulfide oxidoreductase n=1 Tax=Arcticibacterium luteifluviistationis TaxID=1784714 RepID=A0A2Z4GE29_9BACT|nr:FAD-dependent oxidoreductase [Arcticibacterium luteifluviistationis]AWV99285.1 pyridine nucleotide-disulfide oxidoreductase [Arcticibacterium luteifluviistationis]
MKKILFLLLFCQVFANAQKHTTLFIETESFENKGGWVIDQQFMDVMGSSFLMAHGMGIPVADASTKISFPKTGKYHMYVRTRNWSSQWSQAEAAGQFQLAIDGKLLPKIYGNEHAEWAWTDGGEIAISSKDITLSLKDLTGFNGRCDAIIFTNDPDFKPIEDVKKLSEFRNNYFGFDNNPRDAGEFDFVIVGGGMAGTCAAISAARNGVKVALIQNRPLLGGNNSSEVRVHLGGRINLEPYPALGNLVNEIGPDEGGNAQPKNYYEDDKKLSAVLNEPNISLFLNHHANKVETENGIIKSVYATNIETGEKVIFKAPLFADCTGDGTIGILAGAEYMTGRESKAVYNEPTAPEVGDNLTMGASVQWFSEKKEHAVTFPEIKWGMEWDEAKSEEITKGDWEWETGMGLDMTLDFEQIRDYGMLAVYSNWSYLKNKSVNKDKFKNESIRWVAYIAGKRESARLKGDYVLIEQDLTERRVYPDGTAPTSWTIDLHYPDPENSKLFPGAAFKSIAKHIKIYPYPIPFRCLYSTNVNNLMMAGRDISVSHVALGTVRLMRTGGMMGEVLGMAAAVCKKENTNPRGLYQKHFDQLEALMIKGVGNSNIPNTQDYNKGGTLMETENK